MVPLYQYHVNPLGANLVTHMKNYTICCVTLYNITRIAGQLCVPTNPQFAKWNVEKTPFGRNESVPSEGRGLDYAAIRLFLFSESGLSKERICLFQFWWCGQTDHDIDQEGKSHA